MFPIIEIQHIVLYYIFEGCALARQQKLIRRKAADSLIIYDISSNQPIGQVVNMTVEGMKLAVEKPIKVNGMLYCRMELPRKILGNTEVFFDAECRWCKKNEATGKYDTGYKLRYVSAKDKKVVGELIRQWMIHECEALNAGGGRKKSPQGGIFSKMLPFLAK